MAEQNELATIKNVVFLYTKIKDPVLTKNAQDKGIKFDPKDPLANSEWTLQVVVPEKTFKALKRKFKNATNFKNAKEFTVEEFNEKFFVSGENVPNFGDTEDVVSIKFSQVCRTSKGKDCTAPKVIGVKGKVQDHKGLTVNNDVLIGNGSIGHLQIRPVFFETYSTTYLYPQAICITDLVEYHVTAAAEVDYDAFDIEELDEVDVDAKGSKAKADEDEEEFEDDIPFD